MSWVDFATSAEAIRAIYGDHAPSLEGVTLQEITLDHDGSSVMIEFDLPDLTAVIPKKWERKGADFVRLKLEFFMLSGLSIWEWAAPVVVDLRMIELNDRKVNAAIDSEVINFNVTARLVRPRGISAHKESSR